MVPKATLQKMSPIAGKAYLILLAHLIPRQSLPIVSLPMKTFAPLLNCSPRTCARALHELSALKLIRRLPFRYHKSRSYLLLPFPENSSHPAPQTVRPPQSTHPPTVQPPLSAHTPAPTKPTPAAAPKTQDRTSKSALLNQCTNQP